MVAAERDGEAATAATAARASEASAPPSPPQFSPRRDSIRLGAARATGLIQMATAASRVEQRAGLTRVDTRAAFPPYAALDSRIHR
jgi:hypothetical protein